MFWPFWDESALGFFDQEIILRKHFFTSCADRLRCAVISIPNHQIRETRWFGTPDVGNFAEKVMLNALALGRSKPKSKLLGSISPKKVIHGRRKCWKVTRAMQADEEESLEATVAI